MLLSRLFWRACCSRGNPLIRKVGRKTLPAMKNNAGVLRKMKKTGLQKMKSGIYNLRYDFYRNRDVKQVLLRVTLRLI